jgi:F-type H+-transporting ATPase subunit delta
MEKRHPDISAYALSLHDLGRAAGDSPALEREVSGVLDLLDRSPEICEFLANPLVANEGKVSALESWLKGKISPALRHFLLMLIEQGQWGHLRAIAASFFEMAGARDAKAAAELTSAVPLSAGKIEELEAAMSARLKRPVKFHVRVDPGVIGGVSARVGDIIIDGTVSRRLEQLREALAKI